MNKAKVIDQKAENAVMKERLYLSNMRSPFIVNIICAFQDLNNLYLGLELKKGGDLRYHLINHTQTFTESQVKFLASNLIMGLEYIHSKNIIHRDLKPENILFDNAGYAYITDFNISCKKEEINNLYDISGTPVYMAPESISQKFQDFSIDFYSLGVICYECIMGRRPYEASNRHEVKKILAQNEIHIEKDDRISDLCETFINGLLEKNPAERLGAHSDALELKENLFFKGFNWDILRRKKYVSPIAEIISFARGQNNLSEELFDAEFCNKIDDIDDHTKLRYSQIMSHENYPMYFRQYTFLSRDAVREIALKQKLPAAPPKKSLNYSRSSENINLPLIKTNFSNKSRSNLSNGGKKYTISNGPHSCYRSRKKIRYPSDNNSLKDYYEYKLNKYKQLLQKANNNGNPYNNYPNINYYGYFPNPMDMNPYQNRRNGNDIYNDVCNGLQRKIYKDIFGGFDEDFDRDKKRNVIPNQYQINNYFAPPFMMPGMGIPNPYFNMMYPYGILPPINPGQNPYFKTDKKHTTKTSKKTKDSKKTKKSKKSEKTKSKKSESESSEEESEESEEEESEESSEEDKKKESDEEKSSEEDKKKESDEENSEDEDKKKESDEEKSEDEDKKKESENEENENEEGEKKDEEGEDEEDKEEEE